MNRKYDPITGFPLWLPEHLRYKRIITCWDLRQKKGICRWCGEIITAKGRTRWCSDECVNEFNFFALLTVQQRKVLERDGGWKCSACGETWDVESGTKRTIEIDHIIPVVEGGGCCGLINLRQLCRKCHGRESGALRKRLNHAKRCARGIPEQKELPI